MDMLDGNRGHWPASGYSLIIMIMMMKKSVCEGQNAGAK